MSSYASQLHEEQQAVDRAYGRLDDLRAEMWQRLDTVRAAGSHGSPTQRSERDSFATMYENRLTQLRSVEDRLVFGRLDAKNGDRHYIGRIGLSSPDHEPILTDWRAEAARPFYEATPSNHGDIVMRRHITLSFREVVGVEDEVLDVHSDQVGEASSNGTLTGEGALLASLNAKRTGKMTDIVATIQGEQDRIIRADLNQAVVVQGGPGTGKTTTINMIIRYFESEGMDIFLAAPTGRAAKRMTEATGFDAKTIHRLLELNSALSGDDSRKANFERNQENPLEADVVIIDEMSMVDIALMHSLLLAVTAGTRLILVGDENQLPSVGPGNVFRELIQCGAVPVTVLDQIFRQGKGSLIAANAYKMLNNSAALEYGEDFVFLPADNAECAAEIVEREYRRMTAELGIDQVQVLTPYRKSGAVSVNALNERLWNLVNPKMPGKAEMKVRGRIFREKDKVIHNKNKNEISNGDTGFITGIYLDEDNLEVSRIEFPDNRCVEYSSEDMEMIEHAYATTVHKSQGSEYSVVILPWMPMFYKMLRRNILYTAITRAKVKLILVGSKQAVYRAVHNTESDKRNTRLGEMILKERYALESREKIVPLPDADRTKYEQIAMNF